MIKWFKDVFQSLIEYCYCSDAAYWGKFEIPVFDYTGREIISMEEYDAKIDWVIDWLDDI